MYAPANIAYSECATYHRGRYAPSTAAQPAMSTRRSASACAGRFARLPGDSAKSEERG
jgi:hypothetical protein